MKTAPLLAFVFAGVSTVLGQAPKPVPAPSKQSPPPGIAIPESDRKDLTEATAALAAEIAQLRALPNALLLLPDIEIFHKAVHDALTYNEFFDLKQIPIAKTLLAEGQNRAQALRAGQAPWTKSSGLVVRGYRSRVDGSVQPYGLVIPSSWKPEDPTPRPLYSWLHGRSENLTELAFLSERMKKPGEFTPENAFVLHLYGRFCNASKFAGETDFFEAAADVRAHYPIDPKRWVALGFSMGGASCWHLAAHHAGLFVAASPGAGFAETAEYNQVFAPGKVAPPWWEQVLWRLYNATDSAENLANVPLIAYSGEIDGQKQSADIMEKAMAQEGLTLERLIGPQTGHKYEPQTKKALDSRLAELAAKGRDPLPAKLRFTTYTLRYNKMAWLEIDRLEKHWERAQIAAEILDGKSFQITTKNVTALSLKLPSEVPTPFQSPPKIVIDGQTLIGPAPTAEWSAHLRKNDGKWSLSASNAETGLAKIHGLSGPIDDAFTESFLFVRPTGKPLNSTVGNWVESEIARALPQWRTVFRGEAPVKDDTALTESDIANHNLVLWGDPSSNAVLAKILPKLPLQWSAQNLSLGKLSVPTENHVPILIFPNPLNPKRYVVLNSSFTFRQGSSVTNSQQTPKLPDWAIVDLRTPPSDKIPGQVVDAGFFNESWALP